MATTLPGGVFIICCLCGVEIQQNPSNMCVSCLRDKTDITEGIHKQVSLHSCRSCGRFQCPQWQHMALESKELMAVCLRKISGLSRVKLIDAVWIWTEPHSMRLKIKITIQKEVMNGAILQQATVVDFIIRNLQCKNCEASYAQGAWHAVVQVRQRVNHKRTFFYLEQIILKHDAQADCLRIVTFRDGMDFYFKEKNQALRFNDFLSCHVPTKVKYSRKLVSADHCSNVGDFKHNFLIDIAPICKDDLLVLPADLARNLSNISRVVLVKRVGAGLHVIDPFTAERNEVNTEKYWRYGFQAVLNSRQLIRYVVLAVEPLLQTQRPSARVRGGGKMRLAECVVAREDDLGANDSQFSCVSHLGHILNEGDIVLGYDLTNINWNIDEEIKDMKQFQGNMPDLILVRKFYGSKGERRWGLKQLAVETAEGDEAVEEERDGTDREGFLQEIDGDKEMRKQINLYRKGPAMKLSGANGEMEEEEEDKNQGEKKKGKKSGKRNGVNKKKISAEVGQKRGAMETDGPDKDAEEDLDDEEVRLEELLEDMALSGDGALAGVDEDAIVLAPEVAAAMPALLVKGFDEASYDLKDFKFT